MAITEKYVSSLAAGSGTGGLGSPYTFTQMVTEINAGAAAGNRYNVIADGTYSRSASDTISGSGSLTSPVIIRGYKTTIGDGYQGRTKNNGPLVATNLPLVSYVSNFRMSVTGSFISLETFSIAGNVNSTQASLSTGCTAKSCVVQNASTGASATGVSLGVKTLVIDCDISLTGASGGSTAILFNSSAALISGSRIIGGPASGIIMASASITIASNTIFNCGGSGIVLSSVSSFAVIADNTIAFCTGDGINIVTGNTSVQPIVNNCITDNGGYGINGVSAANAVFAAYNRFRDNANGATNLATDWITATNYGAVTSGSGTSDYTNAGGNDYSLVPTSPAVGAGQPYAASIGALQLPASGGTTVIIRRGD